MGDRNFFKIPSDWEYRGEGNCHVVIGLPKLKKVLRIRKRDKPRNLLEWFMYFVEECISWWYDIGAKVENRDLNFHTNIMRPLLGFRYVSEAKQVQLSRSQVKKIECQLSRLRPDFRKHKMLHYGRASLFHDFTTLDTDILPFKLTNDTYSVEIKPKKGWIAFSERNFPECIFCMNQYIKLEAKKICEPSSYCPKELFSGEEAKVKKSISSLIASPQNNFRIFKNGLLTYDESKGKSEIEDILKQMFHSSENTEELLADFSHLLFKCLTRNIECLENCGVKLFCKWDEIIQGNTLPKGCVLEKILSVQMLDVEGTKYYNKLLCKKITEWGYVNKLLHGLDPGMCVKCALLTMSHTLDSSRRDLVFAPYLIAAVANDCSLMITFRKVKDEYLEDIEVKDIIKTNFGSFVINIGIIDLYPKPMSTIRKHELRNKKLLQVYETLKKQS